MANYNSVYTGAEIDEAVGKATFVANVNNPVPTNTPIDALKIGNVTYRVQRMFYGNGTPSAQLSSGYKVGDVYIDKTNNILYWVYSASGISIDWRHIDGVTGTTDGTNWTSLTIGGVTHNLGGGSGGGVISVNGYTGYVVLTGDHINKAGDDSTTIDAAIDAKLDATKTAVSSVGGLVTPTVTLTNNELVGVGTNGEQIRVQLGTGLILTGNTSPYVLKPKYEITAITETTDSISVTVVNNSQ